jgi:hypothetical protein
MTSDSEEGIKDILREAMKKMRETMKKKAAGG